ncbi:hypothetical protein EON65_31335 [archaeon]|nr:MAG: hypothetical protein EON65_31335 [archaeon]
MPHHYSLAEKPTEETAVMLLLLEQPASSLHLPYLLLPLKQPMRHLFCASSGSNYTLYNCTIITPPLAYYPTVPMELNFSSFYSKNINNTLQQVNHLYLKASKTKPNDLI